jgi:hypothetical protein
MAIRRTLAQALCAATIAASAVAHAGSFDCAVVYDEFESLMNKRFLVQPDSYVRTQPGRISQEQFEGVSNANFLLYPAREGMGIGILQTNQNIHAKFLFHWSQPMTDGSTHLIIDEVVKYGRVSDGYAPSRIGPFRLKPGMSIDIDRGDYVPMGSTRIPEDELARRREAGDLLYETDPDGGVLRVVNGAEVQFPLETLCRSESS